MVDMDDSPVDMSLIPLCVKYHAEHFIAEKHMWNSTTDSLEDLHETLKKAHKSNEKKTTLEDIVD